MPIPVRMVVETRLYLYSAIARLLLSCPNPTSTINNERQHQLASNHIGVQSIVSRIQFRFEWSSWIRIHLTIHNSRTGRSPNPQRDNPPSIATSINLHATVSHCIGARPSQSNKELNSTRFEWNGRLGVEFDHGRGVARPSLSVR